MDWVFTGAGANIATLRLSGLYENVTIAASSVTDSSVAVIPANSIAAVVPCKVGTTIPTATTFDIGVPGATTRYGTGLSTASGTSNKGADDGFRYYSSATAIRITPNLTPATNAGRLRLSVYFWEVPLIP